MAVFRIAVIGGDGIGPEVIDQAIRVAEIAAAKARRRRAAVEPAALELRLLQEARPDAARRRLGAAQAARRHPVRRGRRPERAGQDHRSRPAAADAAASSTSTSTSGPRTCSPACRARSSARSPARSTCSSTARTPRASTPRSAGSLYPGTANEIAVQTGVFTRRGCERIMRAAFEAARKRPRKKLTSITKSNALVYGMGLWDEAFNAVRKDYPDVQSSSLLVDAAAMDFVRKPETFDVVVASNLFGDILTDLSAAVTGSIGLAARANINPTRKFPSMFEPVHGCAPDIAGKGIANPLAAILSAALMLDHLGLDEERQGGARRGGECTGRWEGADARPRRNQHHHGNGRRGGRGNRRVTHVRR